MSELEQRLEQAITAAKTGDKARARELLNAILERQPDNATAWLWLSGAVETIDERRKCLERVLAIDPDNVHARRGLQVINTRFPQAASSSTGEAPVEMIPTAEIPPSTTEDLPKIAAPQVNKNNRLITLMFIVTVLGVLTLCAGLFASGRLRLVASQKQVTPVIPTIAVSGHWKIMPLGLEITSNSTDQEPTEAGWQNVVIRLAADNDTGQSSPLLGTTQPNTDVNLVTSSGETFPLEFNSTFKNIHGFNVSEIPAGLRFCGRYADYEGIEYLALEGKLPLGAQPVKIVFPGGEFEDLDLARNPMITFPGGMDKRAYKKAGGAIEIPGQLRVSVTSFKRDWNYRRGNRLLAQIQIESMSETELKYWLISKYLGDDGLFSHHISGECNMGVYGETLRPAQVKERTLCGIVSENANDFRLILQVYLGSFRQAQVMEVFDIGY